MDIIGFSNISDGNFLPSDYIHAFQKMEIPEQCKQSKCRPFKIIYIYLFIEVFVALKKAIWFRWAGLFTLATDLRPNSL
jgi:hypothetical protein